MYKLIAIDLDGTMLDSYGNITENTRNAINLAKSKGIDVVIASGRTTDSVKNFVKEINCENYFISGNGAILYDVKNDKIIYEKILNKRKVLEIIKICEENSIFYSVCTEDETITKSLNYNIRYYYKENLKRSDEKVHHINIVENVYEYIKNSDKNRFMKIVICDENKYIFNSILRKLKKIKNIETLDIEHMSKKIIKEGTEEFEISYFYTEISACNADKWKAIEYIMKKENIRNEEIIAIGDNINDKKMIINAGIGIAMGQSTKKLTEVADYVTNDNNSDGVANAIMKFI